VRKRDFARQPRKIASRSDYSRVSSVGAAPTTSVATAAICLMRARRTNPREQRCRTQQAHAYVTSRSSRRRRAQMAGGVKRLSFSAEVSQRARYFLLHRLLPDVIYDDTRTFVLTTRNIGTSITTWHRHARRTPWFIFSTRCYAARYVHSDIRQPSQRLHAGTAIPANQRQRYRLCSVEAV